jgi:hypothetical protein
MTTKFGGGASIRHKISAPVMLVSTTNMLSYNAPDLYPSRDSKRIPSSGSSKSGDESDDSLPALSMSGTPSPDGSTAGSSPVQTPISSPEPNHLSQYFPESIPPSKTIPEELSIPDSPTPVRIAESPATEDEPVPVPMVPQRAPSHSKKAHEALHRKRSISRMSANSIASGGKHASHTGSQHSHSASVLSTSSSITRDSISLFNVAHASTDAHPFGPELAQVTELAEEYSSGSGSGVASADEKKVDVEVNEVVIVDEEEQNLAAKGLFKFEADEYMREIETFFRDAFGVESQAIRTMWI